MRIKHALAKISPEDRKAIMDAFENENLFFIRLPGKEFLGVHMNIPLPGFMIEESAGFWCIGKVCDGQKDSA